MTGRYEFEQPDERLEFTGERYTPDVGDQVQHEHFHRYLLALRFCAGRRVVDVACGEGYGAALLAQAADEVVGVDSSAEAVEHASKTYGSTKLVFRAADATSIPVEDGFADVVVSFETIEHLADQPAFVAEVARILRPDGMLVLSTPDRSAALEGDEPNPFHVHELDRGELTLLLERRFARVVVGGQRSDRGSSISFSGSAGATFFDRAGPGSFEASEELPAPAYLIAVATNGALPELASSALFDRAYLPDLHAAYHEALEDAWAEVAARDRRFERLERDAAKRREALLAAHAKERVLTTSIAELESDVASLSRQIEALRNELAEASSEPEAARPSPLRRLAQPLHAASAVGGSAARAWRRPFRRSRRRGRSPVARPQAPVGLLPAAPALSPDEAALPPAIRDDAIVANAAAWSASTAGVRKAERLVYRPLVSVLMPTYDTPPELLHAAVRSVLAQSYREWELVIADDGSITPGFDLELGEVESWDARIRVVQRPTNGGISAATNTALREARGEFVAMLDHDDELHRDALLEIVAALNDDRTLDAVYTDQEYVEADGSTGEALLKPDWSPTLFCGVMYVGHLLAVRRELALAAGGFDSRFDNVQDFEFMLRVSERTERIAHVPRVLYRWRRIPGSVAFHGDEKTNVNALQAAAVTAHLERVGIQARAQPHPRHAHRAELVPLDGRSRTVSVVVLLAEGGEPDTTWEQGSGAAIERVVQCGPGSSLREATEGLASDFVLVLEDGVVPESDGWIANLVLHAGVEDVAAVAPIVLGSAGPWVDDAGLILGLEGDLGAAMRGWDSAEDGYAGSLSCAREVSAVSGTCALIATATLERLGGFSELYATPGPAWADLSLRARSAGLRNVVTPRAIVRRGGPLDEPDPLDRWLLRDTWAATIAAADPYHNANFEAVPGGYGR